MDQYGGYDGWINFQVTLKPSIYSDYHIKVIGNFSDRHNKYSHMREYIEEIYAESLDKEIDY